MTNKTLIGKNNILFLINDLNEELEVLCNNKLKVHDITLSRYSFDNFFLFVYPNKSLIYKEYLPDEYNNTKNYRPALDIYKNKLLNNIYDLYEILKNEDDIYYKTDTHINVKGNYIVYKFVIEIINSRLNTNIIPKTINLSVKKCNLITLGLGIGDLTWKSNLGQQVLQDVSDNFYFTDETSWFYCSYKIQEESNIKFLNNELMDETSTLKDKTADWNIISNYIINVKNTNKIPLKIIIFYDSFLLNVLPLYFDLFNEVFLLKKYYSNDIIKLINPDYVFEFRIERFLT